MISAKIRLHLLQNHASTTTNKGFSTVEVLVSVLLTLIFLGVAMQAMVMATAIKIKAYQDSDATNWIQKDVEFVRAEANELNKPAGATGAITYPTTPEKCAATTASTGYAADLQDVLMDPEKRPSPIDFTSSIGDRKYRLVRETNIQDSSPQVLRLTYKVYRGTDTTTAPVSTFYTESIPAVAFSCRQEPA
jgi:hypothetical protein